MIPQVIHDCEEILSVVLFGSMARGDADGLSDKDIFVMCDCLSPGGSYLPIKQRCQEALSDANLSVYTREAVRKMALAGSLFLWHLKLEGRVLLSRNGVLEDEMQRLCPYSAYRRDFYIYRGILDDISRALARNGELSEFDLSLLFTLARNTCMLFCVKGAAPKFGRTDVFVFAQELARGNLPLSRELYDYLLACKLWYERAVPRPIVSHDSLSSVRLVSAIQTLLDYGEQHCL